MSSIAVITARGGSKRIPRKNIKEFCGKPIIAYSIEAALESGLFDEVMVSTDDEEIAEIAKEYGASVPFLRSENNSDDHATSADVLSEVLFEYRSRDSEFDILACIYPTAPFITAEELRNAAKLLTNTDTSSVVAVTDFDFPPQRAFLLSDDGNLTWERPENALTRSQDLPRTAHDCGRVYFWRKAAWVRLRYFIFTKFRGVYIDPALVQDIDTPSDWRMAEMKYLMWKDGESENETI